MDLPGVNELKMLAPGQVPSHELVRSDGVVVAKGSLDRLSDLKDWLNATPVSGEAPTTFEVRAKQRRNQSRS